MVNWEDGKLLTLARVNEDGTITPAVYEGKTPLSAHNLNKMQTDLQKYTDDSADKLIEDGIIVSTTEPTIDRRKVWIRKGKNLFDKSNLKVESAWQATYSIDENKKIKAQCTATSGVSYVRINSTYLKAGTYTFSANVTGQLQQVRVRRANETAVETFNTSTGSFTIENDEQIYFEFYIWATSTTNSIEIQNIQIERGSEATEYEAYTEPTIYIKNDNDEYEEFTEKEDTGWINCILENGHKNVEGAELKYRKIGNVVYLKGQITNITNEYAWKRVASVPFRCGNSEIKFLSPENDTKKIYRMSLYPSSSDNLSALLVADIMTGTYSATDKIHINISFVIN